MDAIDYCIGKVAARGTPGYYAVLFHPPPVRAALLALRALERELSEVVELCSDHDVAQHKLNYWHRELHGNNESAPHPVTRALREHAGNALDEQAKHQLLAGVLQRISQAQIRDDAELDQLCVATAGTIAGACARFCDVAHHVNQQMASSSEADDGPDAVAKTAIAAERLRLLSLPRRAGLPVHSGLALTTLSGCAITPQQVDNASDSADDQAALVRLRGALLTQVANATERAEQVLRQQRGYLRTCLSLTRCLLSANQRNDYATTGQLSQVAPLRLLWHAWRHKPND